MPETNLSSRWYPEAVLNHNGMRSYRFSRATYKDPYDLATDDGKVVELNRCDRHEATATVLIENLHPKFRGFAQGVPCDFILRSSITQLGVNAVDCKIELDKEKGTATVQMKLRALSPLGVLLLDYIIIGSLVGKLFAPEPNRLVRNPDYILRLAASHNQKGEPLLQCLGDKLDWQIKVVDNRAVAFIPLLDGTFNYNGEIHGLLPSVGKALKSGTTYKDLLRLHQEFHQGRSRIAVPEDTLMVRCIPMGFRTVFGRIVKELLPEGLSPMSSTIIEPGNGSVTPRNRTFIFQGESREELTHIPVEFYTLESYREQVPFKLRKSLSARCSCPSDILRVFASAPKGMLPCCAYLCKGGQFNEMTETDWITADPKQTRYVGFENPEQQQELVSRYAYQQCEYGVLSAIAADDISSDGVLVSRYFPSPCLKSLILSRAVGTKLRAIYFNTASRHYGNFFSQEDAALLGDLTTFGISCYQVNQNKGEVLQFIRRPGRDAGVFVPLERRQEYLDATFFGVYGSNLVAGDFEAELMVMLNGILQIKKTCTLPLLNPNKPLALVTGGGPGAMEVGNRVAKTLGMLSCGLIVDFGSVASKPGATINEQKQNPYVDAYFTYRADKLVERQSDFNLDFPIFLTGGIGTDFEYALEEVRRKVGTVPAHPMILFGSASHWGNKISNRYKENSQSGTIKGSEWISTVPWVVSTGKEALEIYRLYFAGKLPVGPGHPTNDRGFMVAAEFLATQEV